MNRIKELRKLNGWTLSKLSQMTHIATNTLNQYELEKREPNFDTLNKLATLFNCSVDYLLGRDTQKQDATKIPVYGEIPAGIPTEMIDPVYIEDYEDINPDLLRGGHEFFGLKVKGTSMIPEFRDGDTLIIKKQNSCQSGDYCAVSINHTECTFKKVVIKENGITLQPLNPEFEPVFFSKKEINELPITILGVVKEVRRSY